MQRGDADSSASRRRRASRRNCSADRRDSRAHDLERESIRRQHRRHHRNRDGERPARSQRDRGRVHHIERHVHQRHARRAGDHPHDDQWRCDREPHLGDAGRGTRHGHRQQHHPHAGRDLPCGRAVRPAGSGGTHGATARKVTSSVRVMMLTVAVTRATTGVAEVRFTVATPLVVVRMIACTAGVTLVNVPFDVVNSTAVPLGAGWPFSVTVAVMTTVLSTNGLAFEVVSTRVAPVGGAVPPGGTPPPGGGAVGVSPLHAAKSSSSASSANQVFRSLILIMPVPPYPSHTLYAQPPQLKQKSSGKRVASYTRSPPSVSPKISTMMSIFTTGRPVTGSRPPLTGCSAANGA